MGVSWKFSIAVALAISVWLILKKMQLKIEKNL